MTTGGYKAALDRVTTSGLELCRPLIDCEKADSRTRDGAAGRDERRYLTRKDAEVAALRSFLPGGCYDSWSGSLVIFSPIAPQAAIIHRTRDRLGVAQAA